MITIRRVYDAKEAGEHYKVFVDRLWPRGISKEKADWDEWMKEISPSATLRKWFNHDPEKWEQFRGLYKNELASKQDELTRLKQLEQNYGDITLLFAAKDEKYNNAIVLKELLETM